MRVREDFPKLCGVRAEVRLFIANHPDVWSKPRGQARMTADRLIATDLYPDGSGDYLLVMCTGQGHLEPAAWRR